MFGTDTAEVGAMVMRFDPFRDLDRLADQMMGGPGRAHAIPMDAYRRGDEVFLHSICPASPRTRSISRSSRTR